MPTPMTGAELKVALQGLALPPTWFGDHMGVEMRTVVRWFDSDRVPPKVEAAVQKLVEQADDFVAVMSKGKLKKVVVLQTYRTDKQVDFAGAPRVAAWHRMLTDRVAKGLRARGKVVRIEYVSGESAEQSA